MGVKIRPLWSTRPPCSVGDVDCVSNILWPPPLVLTPMHSPGAGPRPRLHHPPPAVTSTPAPRTAPEDFSHCERSEFVSVLLRSAPTAGLERSAISCAGWCRAKEGRGCGQQESPLSHHDSGVSLRPAELSRTRRVSALVDHQWGAASPHRQGLGKRVQFGGSSSSIFSSWLWAFFVPLGGGCF